MKDGRLAHVSNPGVHVASHRIYDNNYSTVLLLIVFPAACGGDILAIIDLPLCGNKCAAKNVAAWAILMDKAPQSISFNRIVDPDDYVERG